MKGYGLVGVGLDKEEYGVRNGNLSLDPIEADWTKRRGKVACR